MNAVLLLAAACLVASSHAAPTPPKSDVPAPLDTAHAASSDNTLQPSEGRQFWSPEQLKEQMAGVQVDETGGTEGDMQTDESRWGGRGWGGGYGRRGWGGGYGGYGGYGGWGGGYGGYGGGWRRGGWGGYGGYGGYGYGRSYYRPYFGGSWGFYG